MNSEFNSITVSIGWILIHFLWQGTLISLCYWVLTKALGNYSYLSKYWIGMIAVTLCLIIPITGLHDQLTQLAVLPTAVNLAAQDIGLNASITTFNNSGLLLFLFNQAIPYLVYIWFSAVIILCVKLARSWTSLQRLQKQADQKLPDYIQSFLKKAIVKMELTRKPIAKISNEILIPAAFGVFRPVILLPASIIIKLPQDQIETILLHELCHIKRNDFIHNLLQLLVETLFFFHPAILWMSNDIRRTREQCCDQMVLKLDAEPLTYAKALTNIADMHTYNASRNNLQIAINDGELLQRIKYLLQYKKNNSSVVVLLPVIAMIVYFTYFLSTPEQHKTTLNHQIQKHQFSQQKQRAEPNFFITDTSVFKKPLFLAKPTQITQLTPKKTISRQQLTPQKNEITLPTLAHVKPNNGPAFIDTTPPVESNLNALANNLADTKNIQSESVITNESDRDISNIEYITEKTTHPKLLTFKQPEYPITYRKLNIESELIASFKINDRGRIYQLKITASHKKSPLFAISVKKALKDWKFDISALSTSNMQKTYQKVFKFEISNLIKENKRCHLSTTGSKLKKPRICR
ncbi:MAG: M56 family metallopeptidase [Proteobacteria bacterium]|nr:M56 family metallopeptidase [Pseudomonadota bacterium]